jgi:hypothetical protein
MEQAHARQLTGKGAGDPACAIGAGVVCDRDDCREGKLVVEIAAQPSDAVLDCALLVVDRHDDVEQS